jgi:hypothetical protein
MSGTASHDTLTPQQWLAQSDPSPWGQHCIAELERWVPVHVERGRLAALALWIGWRGFINMARTCKKFRHWLEWSCLLCGHDYRFVHPKWYTGLHTWCYNDRVIAASLCTTCHKQEMQRMEAGPCRFLHLIFAHVHVHDGHIWSRGLLDAIGNEGGNHGRTGP